MEEINESELDGYVKTLMKHRKDRFTDWEVSFLTSIEYGRFKIIPPIPYSGKQARRVDEMAEKYLN